MKGIVMNGTSFTRGLDRSVVRLEKKYKIRVRKLMEAGMVRLIRKTPVHTGQAVRNYVATVGTPYSGAVKQGPDAVEATNRLALGSERLRGGAAAEAKATLESVDYADPFKVFWITNKTPHIAGLEAGELPEEPFTPRSPQGMFGITLQELSAMLESGRV